MKMADRKTVEELRKRYPEGTRVELVRMDDAQAPPPGTGGTVTGVDDTGSLLVRWDNGSGLNVVYGADEVRLTAGGFTDTVKEQILAIRETGETNMFDMRAVRRIAYREGYSELAGFLDGHLREYVHFIMTGETG